MSISVDEIVSEALSLPQQLRALVAEKIIESLNDPIESKNTEVWLKEILNESLRYLQNIRDNPMEKSVWDNDTARDVVGLYASDRHDGSVCHDQQR
ncbi:addiction module protein [Desulfatirhabdium butyrativorans]|uniref:addiction module protein n=1 Tax=Desulfatirhabdium butyrativorans TaxID=340467 RepID=UPI000550865E|nr:addiction module protein [Desulfatirhabdium butyrativorans]